MAVVGILGANGFIGRHLTRAFIAQGDDIFCFVRQIPADFQQEFDGRVKTCLMELNDTADAAVNLTGIDHVVQLINTTNPSAGNMSIVPDIRENIVPQVAFIQSCIKHGVKSFTFLSSGGTVYGRTPTVPIAEDHATRPLNSYGMTKLVTEQYLQMLCRGTNMRFNILRVANPYGPGQLGIRGQGLIGTIIQKTAKREPIQIFGDGSSARDYIYIDDTVEAIVRAVNTGGTDDIINIGSGEGRSILDVMDALEHAMGIKIEKEYIDYRFTDTSVNILDISKSKEKLKWNPSTSFTDGISKTVDHYKYIIK